MLMQSATIRRIHTIRIDSGEDLLVSLRRAVAGSGISTGVFLTGVGSLRHYRVHVVETTNLPPGDVFTEGHGPFDLLSVTGVVLDGRIHAHITFSNTETARGGHLEEGCEILTFGVVVLAEIDGAELSGWDRIGTVETEVTPTTGR